MNKNKYATKLGLSFEVTKGISKIAGKGSSL
jgi:hypothetical protein